MRLRIKIDYRLQILKMINFCLCAGILCWNQQISFAAAPSPFARQSYDLLINQALDIGLPEYANSAVLANPEIADILTQSAGSLVVAGKKIGSTNLLIRDRSQNTLVEIQLNIVANDAGALTVFGGTLRVDYSCMNGCRKINGDQEPNLSQSANTPSIPPPK